MLVNFKPALILGFILVGACSENTLSDTKENSNYKVASQCTTDILIESADSFRKSLVTNDREGALEFYAQNFRVSGDGYGIDYTFFPENDPHAVFDIIKKNDESEFYTEDLGVFQNGRLIAFFQKSESNKIKDIEYLSQNHWKTFAVCNFICLDDVWQISEYTCFEDSGSPFE